jgi:SEC-C motif-containing protein
MSFPQPVESCPCGTGASYDACCGRIHRGEAQAETAEQLMRSRYSAFVVGDLDYVFRSWHPRTRPDEIAPVIGRTWQSLEIVDTEAGGPTDDEGVVEFRARYRTGAGDGVQQERSRFTRRAGRWLYVDGHFT